MFTAHHFIPRFFIPFLLVFFITVVDPTVFQGQNEFQFFAFSLKWMGVVWYFLVCLYQAKIKLQLRWNSASFLMTLSGGGTWTSLSKHLKIVDFRHISSPTSKLQNKEIWTFLPCIYLKNVSWNTFWKIRICSFKKWLFYGVIHFFPSHHSIIIMVHCTERRYIIAFLGLTKFSFGPLLL